MSPRGRLSEPDRRFASGRPAATEPPPSGPSEPDRRRAADPRDRDPGARL